MKWRQTKRSRAKERERQRRARVFKTNKKVENENCNDRQWSKAKQFERGQCEVNYSWLISRHLCRRKISLKIFSWENKATSAAKTDFRQMFPLWCARIANTFVYASISLMKCFAFNFACFIVRLICLKSHHCVYAFSLHLLAVLTKNHRNFHWHWHNFHIKTERLKTYHISTLT